jgi:predicted kinase
MLAKAFEIATGGIADVLDGGLTRCAFRDAARQRRNRRDKHAVLILLDVDAVFHTMAKVLEAMTVPFASLFAADTTEWQAPRYPRRTYPGRS